MEIDMDEPKPQSDEPQEITWDFGIPLLTNPFILLDFGKVLVITFAILSAIFMLIGIVQGADEFMDMLALIPMFAICILVVGVTMALVMLVGYGNRFPCRFTVNRKGVSYEVTPGQKKMNTAIIIIGVLAGRPGVAGSGFLAKAQESGSFAWADVHGVDLSPRRRVVCIRNSWRTLLRVYCTPENYDGVAAMALDGVERTARTRGKHIAQGRELRFAVLRRMTWWPAIAVFAVISTAQPLLNDGFVVVWVTAVALALGTLCAGTARRVMGLLGLLGGIALAVIVIANGLEVTSYAGGLMQWNGFHAATDADDLPFFLTGCIGVLGLLALSIRNIATGKAR
jgi:hypothetical protein